MFATIVYIVLLWSAIVMWLPTAEKNDSSGSDHDSLYEADEKIIFFEWRHLIDSLYEYKDLYRV